jgi:hypothetical protein
MAMWRAECVPLHRGSTVVVQTRITRNDGRPRRDQTQTQMVLDGNERKAPVRPAESLGTPRRRCARVRDRDFTSTGGLRELAAGRQRIVPSRAIASAVKVRCETR